LRGDVNRIAPLLTIPLGRLRRLGHSQWHAARGSNMAFWREDLEKVDGFDAGFVGWGREDSDMFVRMLHAGRHRKDGRFATAVLHLWHPEADRSALAENDTHLQEVIASGRVRARCGICCLGQVTIHGATCEPERT
jgi:hypothetical protein